MKFFKRTSFYFFSLAVVGTAYLFQNCGTRTSWNRIQSDRSELPASGSANGNGSGTFSPPTLTESTGNGTGYGGKVYVVVGTCNNVPYSVTDAIVASADSLAFRLTRQRCQDIDPPLDIPVSQVTNFTPGSLTYQNAIYTLLEFALQGLTEVFAIPGNFQWRKPGLGTSISVECWGGGGGGGADGFRIDIDQSWQGAAGGGGGYSKLEILMTSLASVESVVVGGGGRPASATPASLAEAGGVSTFGLFLSAGGGLAGDNLIPNGIGGGGGVGITENGKKGDDARSSFIAKGGKGGGSLGGNGSIFDSPGESPGGGGGGADVGGRGGTGANGKCVISYK